MSEKTRIALRLDAINTLEALYALEMMREYVVQKYQNEDRNNERICERIEVTDGKTDNEPA